MAKKKHYINSFRIALGVGANTSGEATPIELPRTNEDISIERISVAQVENGVTVPPNFLMQITEQGGTNTGLFVQSQHARCIAGDGSRPWELAEPLVVDGNVRLSLSVLKLSNPAAEIFVTLFGRRVPAAA